MNLTVHLIAALVPLLIGFLWYNPKTFESIWMREASMSKEKMASGNLPLIFGLSYLLSLMMTVILHYFSDHVFGMQILFKPMAEHGMGLDRASDIGIAIETAFATYNDTFGTFKHGLFHGALLSIVLVLPIQATAAMFERKSFKYILVNWGYWLITLMLMCGILSKWG